MPLQPGERIGAFEVVGLLGAGGMGEVYRARDGRLGRDVALKILPPSVSQDPERLARFDREARLLAALNHPGIAAIYGVEESRVGKLLVLEFVAGKTIAERIARGPLAVDDALAICRQVADAVAFAHANGVIHRDLKPANIKCLPNGAVKVLDFGVAKAFVHEHLPAGTDSLTITAEDTSDGAVLGTPAYMSPEQARAKDVDRRTDIWSFGCVLYEALTGRRLFQRETVTDTLVAVLGEDPDWAALPVATPPAIRAVLRRCLQRDRDRRLHDMADVRIELDDALASPNVASNIPARDHRPLTDARALEIALAAICLIGAIATSVMLYRVVPPLAAFYEAFALELSAPLRTFIASANITARWFVPAVLLLGGAYAFLRRIGGPGVRRLVLVPVTVLGVAWIFAGEYFIAEQALLQAMRLSLAQKATVVERDMATLELAAGEPAAVVGMFDPKHTRDYYPESGQWFWTAPVEAFQLAEAYRAQGDVEAARRIYGRAQEAAKVFDEQLSHDVELQQERWQSRYGLETAKWAPPIGQIRRLPDLVRAVAQQRLNQIKN